MNKNSLAGGIILIIIGIVMMLSVMDIVRGFNVLLLIGAGFLVAYVFSKRLLGLLIPGCIILSIGTYEFLTENNIIAESDGELFLVFLGCAFLAVMLIHTIWVKTAKWGERFWPVLPGGILVLIGTFAMLDKYNNYNIMNIVFRYGWAIAIIIIGIAILISGFTGNRKRKDYHDTHHDDNSSGDGINH